MFIMGSKSREFTPEYKDEAVKLVINTGRPTAGMARELVIIGIAVVGEGVRQPSSEESPALLPTPAPPNPRSSPNSRRLLADRHETYA